MSVSSRIQNEDMMELADKADITAFVWVDRAPRAWNAAVGALLRIPRIKTVHIGFSTSAMSSELTIRGERITRHEKLTLLDAAEGIFAQADDAILFCTWPGIPSPETFDIAVDAMAQDPRVATVSFLSNAAGAFSFPHRNSGTPFGVDGHDEVSLTRLLREHRKEEGSFAPVQAPDGAMILVSRSMWEVCGKLDDYGSNNLALATADLAMRAAQRGFINYLDPTGYITMPFDNVGPFQSILLNPEARHALHQRYSYFPMNYDVECARPNSVLGEVLDSARAKAMGLRILIDGSALGPKEMGTQVLTLKLSLALAAREDVQLVVVAVPDPSNIPAYAQALVRHRKIQIIASDNLNFPGAPHVDIIHRPYQPSSPIPWDRWRSLAKRSVITVQDLIAYRNASYFSDCQEWIGYRDNFARQIANADGVVSISHDVVEVIAQEHIPIDRTRLYVVENGTDARPADQAARVPDAILAKGWASSPYFFVLGATYAHKNRDLAMRVWSQLRAKGYPHKLVMAGASVPNGSLRIEECLLRSPQLDQHMLVLPDIGSEDRNWLLMNSSLVLYLTAAEGFGLVPFEAACVNVPTLFVSFGPLRELTDDPELPKDYRLAGLVGRAQDLLDDPAAARASISGVLKNADSLTWDETARKSVGCYHSTLAQPPRIISF